MTDYATDWRAAGACLGADPDLFFPIAVGEAASTQVARALRICDGCPVRQQCLDFAMRTGRVARHLGRHHARGPHPRQAGPQPPCRPPVAGHGEVTVQRRSGAAGGRAQAGGAPRPPEP